MITHSVPLPSTNLKAADGPRKDRKQSREKEKILSTKSMGNLHAMEAIDTESIIDEEDISS